MIKKIIAALIIIIVLVCLYFFTSQKPASINNSSAQTDDYILFYGNTCPHCKNVEEFISANQINQKIKISQLEVYENESNKIIFSQAVQAICPGQMNNDGLPVPFLVDQKDKKCTLGDAPIIEYLTEKSK